MLNCGTSLEVKQWFAQFLADIERKDADQTHAKDQVLAEMQEENSAALAVMLRKIRAGLCDMAE